jgi:hypothetical protein
LHLILWLVAERLKVFDIEKNIVEKIVGEMMFNPEDDVNSDEEDNDADADADHDSNAMEEQDSGFGSQAELQALRRQRVATVTTA